MAEEWTPIGPAEQIGGEWKPVSAADAAPASEWKPVTSAAPPASDKSFLRKNVTDPFFSGAARSGEELQQTMAARRGSAAGVSSFSPTPPSRPPYETSSTIEDVKTGNWTHLIQKSAFGFGHYLPEMTAGATAGAIAAPGATAAGLATGPAGPIVTAAIEMGAVGMGVMAVNYAKNLGPFYAEYRRQGLSHDEAFSKAAKDATVEGAITGLSFAAFEIKPFAGAVKNLLAQTFAVQPGIAVAGQAVQNKRAGKDITQDLGESYIGGVASTALAAGPSLIRAGVRRVAHAELFTQLADKIARTFDPGSRSPEAGLAERTIRERRGELYQRQELTRQEFTGLADHVEKLTPEQQLKFTMALDSWEGARKGTPVGRKGPVVTPELRPVAKAMREALENRRDTIIDLGKRDGKNYLQNYLEDYFPRIYKQGAPGEAAQQHIATRVRSMSGNTSFLKHRSFDLLADALQAGHELVTNNPLKLWAIRMNQMDNFIFGREVWNDFKEAGLVRPVGYSKAKTPTPAMQAARLTSKGGYLHGVQPAGGWAKSLLAKSVEGWEPVNDSISKVRQWDPKQQAFIERGQYYAPESVNLILDRTFNKSKDYHPAVTESMQAVKNSLNAMQLGFSVFHFGFEAIDGGVSKLALAAQQAGRRDLLGAVKSLAKTPFAPIESTWKGYNVRRAYLGKDPIGGGKYGAEMQEIVRSVVAAGAKVTMPEMWKMAYKVNPLKPFELMKSEQYWQAILSPEGAKEWRDLTSEEKTGRAVKDALLFMPRLAQTLSAPVMEILVPNMKLGVFSDMMRNSLDANPHMTHDEMRGVAQRHWDSVENRLGELNMDNTFMPKGIISALWHALRSPGWKLGTMREIGGGASDWVKQINRVKNLELRKIEFTDKMAYVLAMPVYTMLMSGIYQYARTGKKPDGLDWIYPRDGGVDQYGNETRSALPTYLAKDVMGWYTSPLHEAVAGVSPPLQATINVARNEDYRGTGIYNTLGQGPGHTTLGQFRDVAGYLEDLWIPFSMQQTSRDASKTGQLEVGPFLGITHAPARATESPETREKLDLARKVRPQSPQLRLLREKLRAGEQEED